MVQDIIEDIEPEFIPSFINSPWMYSVLAVHQALPRFGGQPSKRVHVVAAIMEPEVQWGT